MVASVPELTIRTCSMPGTRCTTVSAISTSISVGVPKPSPASAWARTAATTGSKAWPCSIGPQDAT